MRPQVTKLKSRFGLDTVPPIIPAATGAIPDMRYHKGPHTINIGQNAANHTWGPSKWRLGTIFQNFD